MTYGVTLERKMQLGGETVAGTAVPATCIHRGPANSIEDTRVIVNPEENVGYNVPLARVYTPEVGAGYDQPDCEMTFEYIHELPASIKSVVSGSALSTGSGILYDYPFPTTSGSHTFKTFTLEAGNNAEAAEMEYAFVDKWGISGEEKKALMWKGVHWTGRQRTSTTFTASLSPIAVEEILFSKGKLYVDSTGGTIGSTQKTNTWLGFELNCESGILPVTTGDGNLFFSFAKSTGIKLSGSIIVEDDSTATGLQSDWLANTIKLVRMDFVGSATGSSAPYANKLLRIDMAIFINKVNTLDSKNGNDTRKVDFTVVYSIADALFANIKVVNKLAALP
jgi:hypothetical protein